MRSACGVRDVGCREEQKHDNGGKEEGESRNDDAERIRDGPIGIWRGGVGRKWELSGEGGREGGWKKEGERGKMVRRKGVQVMSVYYMAFRKCVKIL